MISTITPPMPPPAENKKPPDKINNGAASKDFDNQHSTRRPRKWARILRALLGGQSLNRFEAERLGDHCLHSTVAKLEGKGVVILRRDETVPGYMGLRTHCCRYTLAPQSCERAAELLMEIA